MASAPRTHAIMAYMTEADVIAHWRKGARESISLAKRAHEDKSYALSLFHCQFGVEKALKATWMQEKRSEPLPTHNLVLLADQLQRAWSEEERRQLDYLTQYAVAARYDDPFWAEKEATEENSNHWISIAEKFLFLLFP